MVYPMVLCLKVENGVTELQYSYYAALLMMVVLGIHLVLLLMVVIHSLIEYIAVLPMVFWNQEELMVMRLQT
jgi:hypothetical protein